MRLRTVVRPMVLALLLAAPAGAFAAECSIELAGELLQQEVAQVRRLVDPRCFVRSSSAGIGLTIVDGRYVENLLELGGDVQVFTQIDLAVPAACPKGRDGPLVRSLQSSMHVATTVLHAVGRVEKTDKKVEAHLICGPASTTIAVSVPNLVRFVATYRVGGIGVR